MAQETYIKKDLNGKIKAPQKWRLKDEYIPKISLDLGSHIFCLIDFLTSKSVRKVISNFRELGPFDVVDDVNSICLLEGGALANIWYSKVAAGCRNELKIRLFGDKGSFHWELPNPEIIYFANISGERKILDRGNVEMAVAGEQRYNRFKAGHPDGFIEAFANLYKDIHLDLSNEKNDNIFGLKRAALDMATMEALSTSNQTKMSSCENLGRCYMKYSIIIPTYNSSGFIESTLENLNVLMSSCENLELVFVDDCSTDNTVAILNKWVASDKSLRARVQLVECSKNSGINLFEVYTEIKGSAYQLEREYSFWIVMINLVKK